MRPFRCASASWLLATLATGITLRDAGAGEVHVSPTGNDAGSGTAAQPFATLARAVEVTRQTPTGQAKHILVHGGKYYQVGITLTPADSGLVIDAVPGETPVLYGGRLITNWEKADQGLYRANLPEVKTRAWDFRILAVNDQWRGRARLPHTGRLSHESQFKNAWVAGPPGEAHRFQPPPTQAELTTMQYRTGDLGPWLDLNNAEITVFHSWDESVVGVKSLDDSTRSLTFASPAGYPPGAFTVQEYVVWNVREGLHEPGQWYLDRSAGALVYWPKPDEDMAKAEVVAPTVECVIRIAGTREAPIRDLTLKGLAISATTTPLAAGGWAAGRFAGAVTAAFAPGCRLLNLKVANVGGQAVLLHNCDGARIEGCESAATGAGGFYCLDSQNAVITGNRVCDTGLAYPSGIGIRAGGKRATGNVVSGNQISGMSYSGIEIGGGVAIRVENNRIFGIMKALNDGAAVYVSIAQDVVVRGNCAYEIGLGKGLGFAYYFDEQCERCVFEQNLAMAEQPLLVHMSKDCIVRDNVFCSHGPCRLWFARSVGTTFARNVVAAAAAISVKSPEAVAAWTDNRFFSQAGVYENLPPQALTTGGAAPPP